MMSLMGPAAAIRRQVVSMHAPVIHPVGCGVDVRVASKARDATSSCGA